MRTLSFISLFILTCSSGLWAQQLFSFTDGATIPDYDSRVFDLEINPDQSYDKLELILNITHSWVNDLELTITNPAGEKAMVFSRLGDSDCFGCDGDDLIMTFSDHSIVSYDSLNRSCGAQPAYSGTAQGMESLNALLTDDMNGTWSIEIKDYWPQESGHINEISLLFSKNLPPSCTTITLPEDESEGVLINDWLRWDRVENANGYLLNLGTGSADYDLYEEMDLGDIDSFRLTGLDCAAQYYAQILPYNDYGTATSCSETTFHTEFVVADAPEIFEKCFGDSITLEASGSLYYSWTPAEWFMDPSLADPVFFGNDDMDVQVVVSNENGCSDSRIISIVVNKIAFFIDTINHVRLNSPGFIEISVDGSPDQFLYEWNGPNGFTSNDQDIDDLEIGCYSLLVEDLINGCRLDTLICVDDLTHAVVSSEQNGLNIYPNPFEDQLFFTLHSSSVPVQGIRILSVEGNLILEQHFLPGIDKYTVNTGHLLPGFYLLQLEGKDAVKRKVYPLVKTKD
jgi:subtilisin-like proprotein convertase family protein